MDIRTDNAIEGGRGQCPSIPQNDTEALRSAAETNNEKEVGDGEDEANPSTSNGSNPENTAAILESGTSKKQLSRAELIQLEAEAIPSVKTLTWNPYTLFPKEVWTLIFGKLTDPKDIENVINSTPEWRQLYFPKRTTLLFPQALSIMSENGPHQFEYYLFEEDYLNCRFVCHAWDQAVQNYLQMHSVHFELEEFPEEQFVTDPMDELGRQYWQEMNFEWPTQVKMQQFLDEIAPTHPPGGRNPFLCGQIHLQDREMVEPNEDDDDDEEEIPDIEECQGMWSTVLALLEKYGRHVKHCRIDYRWHLTPLTWYTKMQHWISLMPNLRVLDLKYDINEFRVPITGQVLTELENEIGINPMPELPHLLFLNAEDLPAPVFNALIRKTGNSLQKLQIKLTGLEHSARLSDYNLALVPCQNLSEAYLRSVTPEDLNHLQSSISSWPLKTLFIGFPHGTTELSTWPDWNRIFKILEEKFRSTLTHLKLELPKATEPADKKKILHECLTYRLNLPRLKKLKLAVPNLTSFDFLLPMKDSLEELHLTVEHSETRENICNAKDANLRREEILKFTGNLATLSEANVWDVFPKLKFIEVCVSRKPGHVGDTVQDYGYSKYCHRRGNTDMKESSPERFYSFGDSSDTSDSDDDDDSDNQSD